MKGRPVLERLGFAIEGIVAGWRREHSFRSDLIFAAVAFAMLLALRPGAIWWAVVSLVVALVLAFELLNSAIEATIDLLHPAIHAEIKAAKDMVAGAVMIIGMAALAVGTALLIDWGMR